MIKQFQQTIASCFPEMSMETVKPRAKSKFIEMADPKEYEKTNLFFIKSKHAFREYRNHEYFESQRKNKETKQGSQSTEFVGYPTPFGINNAYNYMREEISKNYLKKHDHNQFKTIEYRYAPVQKKHQSMKHKRRSINLTLPNLNELNNQSITLKGLVADKLHSHHQPSLKSTNINYLNSDENRELQLTKNLLKAISKEYFINIVYLNKFQPLQKFGNIEIKINIFSYIIKTFLKTKINYLQLTNDQFNLILNKIVQIYQLQRENISFKDVINCKYAHEIFQVLQSYNVSSSEYREIIRHFFIANEDVYTYQFNCIKDQMRFLINLETNCINNDEKIYVFDIKTGRLITNLLELIKYNKDKFVVGINANTYELYRIFNKEKNSKKEAAERIKKWKSIIPNQTSSQVQYQHLSSQKYETIFNNARRKRGCIKEKKKLVSSIRNPSFIERDKLLKTQNIFE